MSMAPKTSSLQDHRLRSTGCFRTEAPRHGEPSSSGLGSKSTAAPNVEQQPLGPDRKLQRCEYCNKQFRPRQAPGARAAILLCRVPESFHKERQRKAHRAAYVAPTTRPPEKETLQRRPAVAALHPWETGVLDIANLQCTEFVVALKHRETASTQVETWPAEVRTFVDQHVARWIDENKYTRIVHAITAAAPKYDGIQSCVLILHHSPMEAGQRTQPGAAYIASKPHPLVGQPNRDETLTRAPAAAALHPWETGVLDIIDCERIEFVLALKDGETAGTRVETWPPKVRALLEESVNCWIEEHKEAHAVRAMTVAAPRTDFWGSVLRRHPSSRPEGKPPRPSP